MVKTNKLAFYILLSIALALFAVTLILLFVPEPKPVTITEKFYIDNNNELHGTIRNDSGKDITFTQSRQQITVSMHVHHSAGNYWYDTDYDIFYEAITLKAGESYKINLPLDTNLDKIEITKVSAQLRKEDYSVGYTLYGNAVNNGTFAIIAVFIGSAGFLFLVGAISNLVGNVIIAKRANGIINDISQRFNGAIYASGYYGNKKQERSDATKTAVSLIGAAATASVFGIGFYRDYPGKPRRDFVICDNALFQVYGKKREYFDIMPQLKENFANAEIVEKRNKLTMTGADGTSYITFTVRDGEKQKLTKALNKLFKNNT
ncbi:MAG: hypothetical protein K2H30_00295 [Clostridia bacterium]|nr:hypothetical protein [Clostridia bacterium]